MESTLRHNIETCAVAYAEGRGLEMVTVARLATGDWRFFDRLGTGASFTIRKYDAIMGWFDANWPADLAWPESVDRPQARAA